MPDMLVKLYDLKDETEFYSSLEAKGVKIKRLMALDRDKLIDFIDQHFEKNWVNEGLASLSHQPISCYVAVQDKKIIGFACYDVTAKNFFGPTGVAESCRGLGVGKALLFKSLEAMREEGYGYAIIGWVSDAAPFYAKTVGAIEIPDSFPGVFGQMVEIDQ